jgi:hypothetical protein
MWASAQKRHLCRLFDHLVRTPDQRVRDGEAEYLGRSEVYHELDFGGLLYRQIRGPLALENTAGLDAGQAVCLGNLRSVTH